MLSTGNGLRIKTFFAHIESLEEDVNAFLAQHDGNIVDIKLGDGQYGYSKIVVIYREEPRVQIHSFTEHTLSVSGSKGELVALAEALRDAEGTVGNLRYQIEYAFDIDGIRSSNTEANGEEEL